MLVEVLWKHDATTRTGRLLCAATGTGRWYRFITHVTSGRPVMATFFQSRLQKPGNLGEPFVPHVFMFEMQYFVVSTIFIYLL